MAWWIHDHLPYHRLYFFPKFAAFNISWQEVPVRRIDSYAPPKGLPDPGGDCRTMAGSHADQYPSFPQLAGTAARGFLREAFLVALRARFPAAKVEDDAEAADGTSPAIAFAGATSTAPAMLRVRESRRRQPTRRPEGH